MIDRHMIIHGNPEGEHTRVEIDYAIQEIRIVNALYPDINRGDMRFRPMYPKYEERIVATLSLKQWGLISDARLISDSGDQVIDITMFEGLE